MKKKPTTFKSIAIRIIALALSLWLCVVGLVTWAVAEDYFHQIDTITKHFPDIMNTARDYPVHEQEELPGSAEARMIYIMSWPYLKLHTTQLFPFVRQQLPEQLSSDDWLWDQHDLLYGFDYSVIYYDEDKQPLMTSGNRLNFSYTDSQNWNNKALDPQGICWVDLDAIEGAAETMKAYLDYSPYVGYSIGSKTFLPLIRLTGWFEGNEFHPVTLENTIYTTDGWPLTDLDQLNYLDLHNKLEWNTLVETEAPADQTLVTIYGWNVDGITGNHQTPVTVDGKTYDSLTDLRLALNHPYEPIRGLWESISFSTVTLQDGYGTYTFALTVRTWPLQYAMLRLMPAYLVFTAIVAVVTWLILRRIRRNLTAPLTQLSTAIQNNTPITPTAHWAELHSLEGQFAQFRHNLTDTQAENTRLNTALDYAKDAEAKRKELISNLAHELKTPLAVIQSYSEGLQAGIAPEKQDQYIRTILDETGRMDHMVMQMLQLSRLESGKAKLNMENFSLNRMIQSVSSKLHPLMEQKNLNLRLELEDNAHMDGDISRMEQVITNYMSNAVKYTCEGGQILIKVTQGKYGIFFSITNTAFHLPDEALSRVYDSFYRQDSSRSEKNSGLGLAIVKSIMTLHGYKCYVLNSLLDGAQAVEFGFFPNE